MRLRSVLPVAIAAVLMTIPALAAVDVNLSNPPWRTRWRTTS